MNAQQTIARFIATQLLDGERDVGFDDEIVLDGTIDSLGVTRLIDHLEREFGIAIPPQDVTIENFRSIATMADYVISRQATESP